MSLAKLLSTGKSLVGGSGDNINRYRMGSPGLLPKFGSGNKPAPEDPGIQAPGSAEGDSTKCLAQNKSPGETHSKQEPAVPAHHRSWLRRIIARVTRKRMRTKPKDVPRFAKNPVQAELLLDRVRVVRNDLSDSDLEIVPARKDSARSEMAGATVKVAEKDGVEFDSKQLSPACEELRK